MIYHVTRIPSLKLARLANHKILEKPKIFLLLVSYFRQSLDNYALCFITRQEWFKAGSICEPRSYGKLVSSITLQLCSLIHHAVKLVEEFFQLIDYHVFPVLIDALGIHLEDLISLLDIGTHIVVLLRISI